MLFSMSLSMSCLISFSMPFSILFSMFFSMSFSVFKVVSMPFPVFNDVLNVVFDIVR